MCRNVTYEFNACNCVSLPSGKLVEVKNRDTASHAAPRHNTRCTVTEEELTNLANAPWLSTQQCTGCAQIYQTFMLFIKRMTLVLPDEGVTNPKKQAVKIQIAIGDEGLKRINASTLTDEKNTSTGRGNKSTARDNKSTARGNK